MNKLNELRASVQELRDEIVALSETEDITPEDDARLTEAVAELPIREAELDTLEARQAVIDRAAKAPKDQPETRADFVAPNQTRKVKADPVAALRAGATVGELRDMAAAAIDSESRNIDPDSQDKADRVMRTADRDGRVARHIVLTGTPEYRSAFAKAISGNADTLTESEREAVTAVRAAALSPTSAGGFAVPFTLDPTIIDTGAHTTNPFRMVSRVVQITTDSWNGVSSAGVTASWDGEAVEVSDDAPTLAQPSISVHKGAAFVPFSIEIGQDWQAMESDVRAMILQAKDDLEGAAFVSGTGTGQPTGIVTALDGGASEIGPAVAESFTLADVYALESSLEARYRSRASWVANKVWYNAVRQFDTGGGAGMWERVGAGQPAELLGYSAYESSDMDGVLPNAGVTADNFGLLFGDFSNYVIVDRVGLSVELVPHLFATANNLPSGQRGFYAHWRVGADSVNDNGIKVLSIPTTA